MRRPSFWLALIALLLITCSGPTPTAPPPDTASPPLTGPATTSPAGPHFLLASAGSVGIKRVHWSDFSPAAFGTALNPEDLLQVQEQATVLCADLRLKQVTSGLQSTPCPAGPVVVRVGGADLVLVYGSGRPRAAQRVPAPGLDIPYVLYPRRTLLLTDHPVLRWNATGAGPYTVTVRLGGSPVWRQVVNANEVRYPDEAPPLQSGTTYTLGVTDSKGAGSNQDQTIGIGFQYATDRTREVSTALQAQSWALTTLSEPDRQFVLALLYLGLDNKAYGGTPFRPLGDVWQILDTIAPAHATPAVYLMLGNVLAEMTLPREAGAAYQVALANAVILADRESQALAHAQLWRLSGAPADLQEALHLYEQLGDKAAAGALQNEAAP